MAALPALWSWAGLFSWMESCPEEQLNDVMQGAHAHTFTHKHRACFSDHPRLPSCVHAASGRAGCWVIGKVGRETGGLLIRAGVDYKLGRALGNRCVFGE